MQCKYDQPIIYAYRLFNKIKHNYITTKRKALAMVYDLHKFKHTLLGNKFVFYVDHMALVYLVNKSHVSRRIIKWLLFIEYEFIVVYKPCRTHVVANALSKLLNNSKSLGVLDQPMDAGSKNMFRDMSNVINYKLSLETEVGQKGKTFHSKRGNYVQNGTRQ